ncbi:polygalacturonase-like [Salvia miltiorrhiza]|uniref:polygalacturonase-like n=1 Tax=Salvia miltiorrhiza TaxID=226208 RepID=UPI0025ABEDA8|nr:polygalacturonase-like [Salvia miltiorrhiza]
MIINKKTQISITITVAFFLIDSSSATLSYNVKSFGAKSNGKSDCTKAFLSAWGAACAAAQPAEIHVPAGRYRLRNVVFSGKSCKNTAITISIDGTLVAPSNYSVIGNSGSWLKFERVTGVSIYGGTLDGRGAALWACKNSGHNCPKGATTLAFYNSNNISINALSSLNSQMFHILIYGCHNVNLMNVKISADGNSPNTDGIHIEQSSAVAILGSRIGTGDDCVSIGPGASDLLIENLFCGPGHGISIGSLGWNLQEAGVQNVTIKTATFRGTQNGLRIKTWARPSNGFVKDVYFQHIVIDNAKYPIIIDQNYCPDHNNCPSQDSGVKISNVRYEDVHGTSATQIAVKFDCSKTNPCSEITLDGVNLTFKDNPANATASCENAGGTANDVVEPTSCLNEER